MSITPPKTDDDALDIPAFLRRTSPVDKGTAAHAALVRGATIAQAVAASAPPIAPTAPDAPLPQPAPASAQATPAAPQATGKAKTKTQIIGDLLTRPEGCTKAEVLAATQWPSVSMPRQAKAVGLALEKTKDGRVTRYRAVPA